MPRYLVERTFRDPLAPTCDEPGTILWASVVAINADLGVTWVHSYVSEDRRRTFCLYDGANPEVLRRAAERSRLPLDRIIRVTVLDPYFTR